MFDIQKLTLHWLDLFALGDLPIIYMYIGDIKRRPLYRNQEIKCEISMNRSQPE